MTKMKIEQFSIVKLVIYVPNIGDAYQHYLHGFI